MLKKRKTNIKIYIYAGFWTFKNALELEIIVKPSGYITGIKFKIPFTNASIKSAA